MAAHRYWRVDSLESYGTDGLELSCLHLLDTNSARLDAIALLSASVDPAVGVIASLQDDDPTTSARWGAAQLMALALTWDFGASPVSAINIQLSGSSAVRFPLVARLAWSDNGAEWFGQDVFAGISYPGAGIKSSSPSGTTVLGLRSYLMFEEGDGANSMIDRVNGRVFTAAGNAKVSTILPGMDTGSLQLDGSGDYITTSQNLSDYVFGSGDFYLMAKIKMPVAGARDMVLIDFYNGNAATWQVLVRTSGVLSWYANGYMLNGSINLRDNQYHDIEVSKTDGVLRFFCDGTPNGAIADANNYNVMPSAFSIGAQVVSRNASYDFLGWIDEFVCAKGVPGHTSAYTPRTTPLYGPRIQRNRVLGRVAPDLASFISAGYPISYGATDLKNPALLTVESGAVKDYVTGVQGTGRGRVSGTVKEKGTPDAPVYRKVRLIRERDGLLIREVWSDPTTGAYSFNYIDELQSWAVVAHDHTFAFRDQIASNLTLASGGVELIP